MATPKKIIQLTELFEKNKKSYLASNYNETQIRRAFIDPLFEELGWDVDNSSGKAEAYKDVVHEDAIKIGKTTKAPDYSFRIGGQRKFFVEAKKPSVNIKSDVGPAYQLRRYSWSAKLQLGILTDFEEICVYDCRKKPNPKDSASVGRLLYIKYDELVERWDELASIFSKDAIEKGSFDEYAQSMKGKRGTGEVDDEFLKEIEVWRENLAKNIALRNDSLDVHQLNYVVQKTIDRLIFLRICEDRGVEPYGQLQNLLEGPGIYDRLKEVYALADEKYNSGLFHFKEEKGQVSYPDTLSETVIIDDKILKDIIQRLYYPLCPYEFSVLGVDILGNVYEQFLGKVIRLTAGHRAVVEEKPEVKKAGGVYYTPKYIVNYIVEKTVGELIEKKSPKQISSIKVLDPACGSGSFLIGAYTYLLDYHLNWYVENKPEKHQKSVYQGKGGAWFLTTQEKKQILLNNIYGVDIDSQAVEVTKLNLSLKVLENENQDTLLFQKKLVRERALPDLGENIKCGNSLIGPDFYSGQSKLFDSEEERRINVFDWDSEFGFKFDAVIGNPPYIRIQAMKEWAPKEVEFYKEKYTSASKGNYDIYVVFIEKGMDLLTEKGLLGYICPHKFFNAQYGEPIRRVLAKSKNLKEIVHFGDQQVFKKATTYTCLLFLTKEGTNKKFGFAKVTDLNSWRVSGKAEEGRISLNDVCEGGWNFIVGKGAKLFEKLSNMPMKLGDVTDRIFQGLITGADSVFILKDLGENQYYSEATAKSYNIENELMHPLCKGSVNIRRYHITELTKSILFPYIETNGKMTLLTQSEFANKYPNAWAYLNEVRTILEKREHGKWKHNKWYAFGRTQNLNEMEQKKILTPSIASVASYVFDENEHYYFVGSGGGGGGGYGITINDSQVPYEYVVALLNSKLIDAYLKSFSTQFSGGYYAYNRQYIEKLPILNIDASSNRDKKIRDTLVELVKNLQTSHIQLTSTKTPNERTRLQRRIDALDSEINKLVYELYGLTKEEIKIVEESMK